MAEPWDEAELTRLGYKVLSACCCGTTDPLPGLLLERATKLHADRQMGGDATTPTGVLYIKCLGDCCKDRPLELHATGGCIYSGNAFEAHAGRQGRKKWRETIRVLPQNISLKAWLSSVGREYNRADSDNERQQHSPDAPRDGFVQAAVAAAAAAAAGRDPLGGAAAPLWHPGEQQAGPLLAVGGLPGPVPLGAGTAPSGLLQALLGQQGSPLATGPPGLARLQAAGLPPGIASLLQHAAHAAPQPQQQQLQHAAMAAAAAAAAARKHAEGASESSALQDSAVLHALSSLVRQLQHVQAGGQQEQQLAQHPPALAAALAAAAAGEQQRGQQDSQWMDALITVVQQLAVQREQLQEQQAQLSAQAQQITALAAQVASQAEQLAAAHASLQTVSAARLRQAEQLSLQARQQQDLWAAVQTLQTAVQTITGSPLPKAAAPTAAPPDSQPAHAAGEAPAAVLRVTSTEAPAQQAEVKHNAHGGAGGSAAGLHQLQAMLAAMAAMSRQQHPQQHLHPQQHPQHPQHPHHPHHKHHQPPPPPQQPQQQVPASQQQREQAGEGLKGSQPESAAAASPPAGGSPATGPAVQQEPAHGAGSGASSPSRKRPRADSTAPDQ